MNKKITFVFRFIARYQPLHLSRLGALARLLNSTAITVIKVEENNYKQSRELSSIDMNCKLMSISHNELFSYMYEIDPEICILNGYSDPIMRRCALWARKHNKLAILMSESQFIDRPRNLLIESIKSWLIKRYFDSAFVGGERSADYLIKLGFPADRIWRGYDVVDNEYFSKKAEEIRKNGHEWRIKLGLPDKYFLYVGRFSPEKNLLKLLEAYRIYKNKMQKDAWGLVLVGSGPQESELKSNADKLDLRQIIFPGFKQINELPLYYALSSCFILPSNSEPWGLVVNEAMASGLPVLVSCKCGCVPELVYPGINGYTFNPENVEEIAFYMSRISSGVVDINKMGEASRNIIQNFSPETWARALADCIEVTMKRRNKY
ncbi:MAG: glycosyltransferase family 4 protein [Thermoplasmata archaeon]